jgi:phenylpyruvate tautomerase PptA (4-oxalocrotonate tautomerase family)
MMPLIQLTVPSGTIPADAGRELQQTLAKTLLRWEGAPDTALFRSLAWSYLIELPAGAQTTAEDDRPRFRVDVTVPDGALSQERKEGLVKEVTSAVLNAAALAESDAPRVWVLIHEQPDGTWGAAGGVIRFAELAALADTERANA